jgi:hypothetical protein
VQFPILQSSCLVSWLQHSVSCIQSVMTLLQT